MNLTLSLGLRHPHIGWVGQEMKPQPKAATRGGFSHLDGGGLRAGLGAKVKMNKIGRSRQFGE